MTDMDQFVGRKRELASLRAALAEVRRTGGGAFIAMRGRRRVGKSRLVEEFARRSRSRYVFYTAVQESSERELDRMITTIGGSNAASARSVRAGARADTWEAAIELAIQGATTEHPLVLVIDEFPYLVEKEPAIEATLQLLWDRTLQRAPVLLILIGSDRATMEALSAEGRPLYDRPREMVLAPLTPADVGAMLGLSAADALDAQVVIGGFPVLAREWGHGRTLDDYLAAAFTDPTSFLIVSAERALAAEFPQSVFPRRVLSAIGSGAVAHKAILQRTGMNATSLERAVAVLRSRGVIDVSTPYSTRASTGTKRYLIADPYLRFWLRFIDGNIDLVERGRGGVLVDRFRELWPSYRGRAIEFVVRDAVERLLPDPRFGAARHVGAYWTRSGAVDVDLVGGDDRPLSRAIEFIGSIKWRGAANFDRADTAALVGQRTSVPGTGPNTRLVGVSRGGFAADAQLDIALHPEDLITAYRA